MLNTIRKRIGFVILLLAAFGARGQQVLSIKDSSAPYNAPVRINISLSNSTPVSAVQFDLDVTTGGLLLPDVSDSIELSDRSDGHVAVLSKLSETTIRILVYSGTNKDFKGSSGRLLSVKCRSLNQPGNYTVSFSGSTVATASGQNLTHTTLTGTISILGAKLETSSPVNIGSIPLLSNYNNSIWITNRGNQALVISQITGSGADLVLNAPAVPLTVGPNSSAWILYTINPAVKGAFRHLVTVVSNDPGGNKVIELTGTAYAVNTISLPINLQGSYSTTLTVPVTISNQEAFTGWQMTIQLPDNVLYVEGSAKLSGTRKPSDGVIEAKVNGNALTLVAYSPSLQTLAAGSGMVATFDLLLNKTAGNYSLPLSGTVIGNAAGENILSGSTSGELSITAPGLALSQSSIDFGRITTKEISSRNIVMTNNGSENLRINGIDINTTTVTSTTTFPVQLAPGQSQSLALNFKSAVPLSIDTSLIIHSNDPLGNRSVRLTGTVYSKNEINFRYAAGVPNGTIRVPLYLENYDSIQGLQFDVQLPGGTPLSFAANPFRLSDQFTSFVVSSSLISPGNLRVIIYSLSGATILPGNIIAGELVLQQPTPANNWYDYLGISNVVLAGSSNINLVSGYSGTSLNICDGTVVLNSSGGAIICGNTNLSAATGQPMAWYRNDSVLTVINPQPYNVKLPGKYNAIVANGCNYWSADLLLTTAPKLITPVLSASGDTTFCQGGSVRLSTSSVNGVLYKWLRNGAVVTGASDTLYTAYTSGTYSVRVYNTCSTDSVTSQAIAVHVLSIPDTPRVSVSGPLSFCNGSSVTLTSSAAANYQWYRDGVLISGATAQSYIAMQPGNYRIYTNNSCSTNASAPVSVSVSSSPAVLTTPVIRALGDTTLCQGNSVRLNTASVTGVVYTWLRNGTVIPGASDTLYVAKAAGNYAVRLYNVCNGDSVSSRIVSITVLNIPDTPTVSVSGPLSFCNGGSVTLTSSSAGNYQWYRDGEFIAGATEQSYIAMQSGNYRIYTSNSCSTTASVPVSVTVSSSPAVLTTPVIRAVGDTTFCQGNSVRLNTASVTGVVYKWLHNATVIPGANDTSYVANVAGNYLVRLYNACNTDSVSSRTLSVTILNIPDTPRVSVSGPLTFCSNSSVTLTSSAAGNYQWYRDAVLITGATAQNYTATQTGSYRIYTNNSCGVNASNAVVVSVNPTPLTPVITFDAVKGELVSSNATGNQWYLNGSIITAATSQNYKPAQSGSYTVMSTTNGCSSAASPAYQFLLTAIVNVDGSKLFNVSSIPATEKVVVRFAGQRSNAYDVEIVDISGRIVKRVVNLKSGDAIQISTLLSGVYVLRFSSSKESTTYTIRIVKLN
jgi:hypothetical protein